MDTTKDYSKFQFLNYNRDISPTSIKKLKKSMDEFGFLVPILTTKDKYVIDGQNRIKAAEELELDVHYKEVDIKSTDERLPYIISRINTTSKMWTQADFLELYVSLKNEHYIRFKNFIEEHDIPIGDALLIVAKSDKIPGGKDSTDFRNGTLNFDNGRMDECIEMVKHVNEIRYFDEAYDDFNHKPRFIRAITILILSKGYNHDQMMNKLSTMKSRIMKSASTRDYIADLFNIYNHGTKTHILVA